MSETDFADLVREHASLPTFCGEHVDVPGTPSVGCVARVVLHRGTPRELSALLMGSRSALHVVGPATPAAGGGRGDAEQLVVRRVWAPGAADGDSDGAPGATVCSVTAVVLGVGVTSRLPDLVAAAVAWVDGAEHCHVSLLLMCLSDWLLPRDGGDAPPAPGSPTAVPTSAVAGSPRLKVIPDVLPPAPPSLRVLRLFHDPGFTRSEAAQLDAGGTILCCYCRRVVGTGGGVTNGENETPRGGGGAAKRLVGEHRLLTVSLRRGARHSRRRAEAGQHDGVPALHIAYGERWLSADPPAEGVQGYSVRIEAGGDVPDVAPWLAGLKCERAIASIAVQGEGYPNAVAAVGTTDGRLLILRQNNTSNGGERYITVTRRFCGPIADVFFTSTVAHASYHDAGITAEALVGKSPVSSRYSSSPQLHGGGSYTSSSGLAEDDARDAGCLLVLDSIGHVLVFTDINKCSGTMVPRCTAVQDVSSVISLVANYDGGDGDAGLVRAMGTSKFLDMGVLRQFLPSDSSPKNQKKMVLDPSPRAQGSKSPAHSFSVSPVDESRRRTPAGSPDGAGKSPPLPPAGNILSRGITCATIVRSVSGRPEIIVATLGNAIVSLTYSPEKAAFVISAFAVSPLPMLYVGLVDFFGTGYPAFVSAGLDCVLVSLQPRKSVRERARLLMRVLEKHPVCASSNIET